MGCGTSFVRYLFFAFNFIFWVLGIVVFALGIYSRVETDGWKSLLDTSTLFHAANLLIAAGVIVATIGFFGCCGAFMKKQWMLIIYCILVILIFILQIVGGGIAYSNRVEVQTALTKGLQNGIQKSYAKTDTLNEGITKAIDLLQKKIKCCGSAGPQDWTTSYWKQNVVKNVTVNPEQVPTSCCKTKTAGCNKGDANLLTDPTRIYVKGCIVEGKKFVKDNLWLIGGVGVGIAVIQLLSIGFAIGLICVFKKDDTDGGTTA